MAGARAAVKPLIVAGLVAYVLSTIVDALGRATRLSRQTLVVLVYFTSLAIFLFLPAVLAPTLVTQSQQIYTDVQFSFDELRTAMLQPIRTPSGDMRLDVEAARDSIARHIGLPLGLSVEEAAWGIHELVNENMARASAKFFPASQKSRSARCCQALPP